MINGSLANGHDRLDAMMAEAAEAGVPARRAVLFGLLSMNETNYTFGVRRPLESAVYPPECYPLRQILKIERGADDHFPLTQTWLGDAEVMDHLRATNSLRSAPSGALVLTNEYAITDSIERPNLMVQNLFEWLIDRRKVDHLRAFSIGPTQMWLFYSPAANASETVMRNRFPTLDDLWRFYTATDHATLLRSPAVEDTSYLPLNVASFPTEATTSCGNAGVNAASCIECFLTRYQTGGGLDWESEQWSNYAKRVVAAIPVVYASARKAGYTSFAAT